MKYIPHDYYLKFMDPVVHAETLDFHAKGNYTIHDAFKHSTQLHGFSDQQLSLLTGNELRLYPDMDLTFPICPEIYPDTTICRNESCETFSSANIDFSIIEKLISPILSSNMLSYKRGYPSGGALYPAEIFMCSLMENNESWPCPEKILHLLPQSRSFEVVQGTQEIAKLKQAILSAPGGIGAPSIAVVYAVYIPKTLFKYRYRGYRLALMEIGSIYMLVELQAKQLGLQCRLWSAYTDTMLNKAIGLNPALFFPMCVHFIGEKHDSL
ncbi:SagB/ThcOx family dehydrogenase [Pseudomonas fluorescens]|jgi:SagB-type dehydrogenase family enzyme|uniref:SagB/ThcOx family dehydrogenase n=1 Tax=Pseudomonas fluorescens TaxID=294 RepID=UPI002ACA280B|nr:SagB/ThcOx family dehydrogenase [Pseudomonas fluorescens]MDZ5431146.1 SagB/ThcOx family dehydrogenase [Pseudomonas fluorescens]